MEKLHFRVMVLDNNIEEQRNLEYYFLSSYSENGNNLNFEDTKFYFISDVSDLKDAPNISAFNSVWINILFPNWKEIAQKFYLDNPFCYQVIYGKNIKLEHELMRSRPIGYVLVHNFAYYGNENNSERDRCRDSIHKEMSIINKLFDIESDMLQLKTRYSTYWIPYSSIIYLQSSGRKTYIYIRSRNAVNKFYEDDCIVKEADNNNDPFAYVQNRKLDDIYENMDHNLFVRVHKSYIVNKKNIRGLKKGRYSWMLYVEDHLGKSIEIPVSDPYHEYVDALVI